MSNAKIHFISFNFKYEKEIKVFAKLLKFDYNKFTKAPLVLKNIAELKKYSEDPCTKYITLERKSKDSDFFDYIILELRLADKTFNPAYGWRDTRVQKEWHQDYEQLPKIYWLSI